MEGMKRVCFMNTIRFWGGGEKLHLEYAMAFRDMGYEVFVVCDRGSPLCQRAKAAGLRTFHLRVRKLWWLNRGSIQKLQQFLQREHIDTLLFSGSSDFKVGSLAGSRAGVPKIVYLRGLAAPIRNRRINRRLLTNHVTHLIANSEETKRTMLRHLAGVIPAERVEVVYHGIDLAAYPMFQRVDPQPVEDPGRLVVIGNAGRLTPQKGHHLLLQVAEVLKERGIPFRMRIAGTGELEQQLKGRIAAQGLREDVVLEGFVEDIPGFMRSVDIFVLTSEWEGFGFVLVEAMAAGKPVVAFDITSNPEIVDHGTTGFLVPFPDVAMMADKVAYLAGNRRIADEMGMAGRRRVEAMFRKEERVRELERKLTTNN